jgi:hypothetical protein
MAGKRGRPVGHRLSDESKKAISEAKRGQQHSQATKDKISRSLILYFKKLNTLSDEVTDRYCRVGDDDMCDWVNEVREDLDEADDILTEKGLRNKRRKEICCGHNIEYFSHNLNPEIIVMFMEYCDDNNLDPIEVIDNLDAEEEKIWQDLVDRKTHQK